MTRGLACATLLFASTVSGQTIQNAGFESTQIICELPTTTGVWGVDTSQSVAAAQGIVPAEGVRMLRFVGTSPCCDGTGGFGGTGSDIGQLVDLSPVASQVASGRAVATFSFLANRIAGTGSTDRKFIALLRAYDGTPAQFRLGCSVSRSMLAQSVSELISDSAASTWQSVTVSLVLPANTTYVVVMASAVEDVSDGDAGSEFDGHFADATTLVIRPECPPDFDYDGFLTGKDYDLFVQAFEAGESSTDFDGDGFVTGLDFDLYVQSFEEGC